MFTMTSNILIGNYAPVKPNAVSWKRSVENFSDTAVIKLPALTTLKKEGDTYENVQTGLQFNEGMIVKIYAGYDGLNDLQFHGFVRRVNFTIPCEVECEGYSYQLRKKLDFSKAYKSTTVRKILGDLIQGTDIKLSAFIPDIPIEKVTFSNASGIQVLDWFKSKCLLTVYFNFDTLYVGGLQLEPKSTVAVRLGWNVIKDSELKFNDNKEFADVRIEVGARNVQGEKKRQMAGKLDGQVKRLNTAIRDTTTQKSIADQKRRELVNRGYEGAITCFLKPHIEPGMAISIDDTKYPERKGVYFVSGVDGDFSTSGGRQKIQIGYSLG